MFNPSRWRNVATARTLCVMLFMAGLGLLVSIIYLLFLSQSLLSSKINEMDTHRTAMSVDGAIQSSVSRVMTLVVDNAIWDDAVYKTYPPNLDSRWLYDTWGAGIKINNLYDGTFVLDEHFNIIWGGLSQSALRRARPQLLWPGHTGAYRQQRRRARQRAEKRGRHHPHAGGDCLRQHRTYSPDERAAAG